MRASRASRLDAAPISTDAPFGMTFFVKSVRSTNAATAGHLVVQFYEPDLDGALLFLAGPASAYVTGAVISVDGGHGVAAI